MRLPVDNARERLERKLMEIPTERAVHSTFGFPARSLSKFLTSTCSSNKGIKPQ